MKRVKAVILAPGLDWKWVEFQPTAEAINTIVGGWIEHITLNNGCSVYVNGEGKIRGLVPCAHYVINDRREDILVGLVMIFGTPTPAGYESSLTLKQFEEVKSFIIPIRRD